MAARRNRYTTEEVVAFFNTDDSTNEDAGNAEETFTDFVGIAVSESEDEIALDEPKPSKNNSGDDICLQPLQPLPSENVSDDSYEQQAQLSNVDDTMPVANDRIINPWESSFESDSSESSAESNATTEVTGIHSNALDSNSDVEPVLQLGKRHRQQPRSRGVGQARHLGRGRGRGRGRARGQGRGSVSCVQESDEGSADHSHSSEGSSSYESGTLNESDEDERGDGTTRRMGQIRGEVQGRGRSRSRGWSRGQGRRRISYHDLLPNIAKQISERDTSFAEPSEFLPLREPGPHLPFPDGHDVTELDLFQLFMTDDMIGHIVDATISYAEAKKESK